jgi:histidinol phosphatase-like enzyme
MKSISIDVDDVILKYHEWEGIHNFREPVEGVKEALAELQKMGYYVIILTTRVNEQVNPGYSEDELVDILTKALDKAGIPWDEISIGKPLADFYVDDRSIKFESWSQILQIVKGAKVVEE